MREEEAKLVANIGKGDTSSTFRKDAGVPSCGVCDVYGIQVLRLACCEDEDAVPS